MKKILFITCAALFTLSSCSNDDEQLIESNNSLQLVQMTQRTSYDYNQFNDAVSVEYTYGSNGFVSVKTSFDTDGNPTASRYYSYNNNNQLTNSTGANVATDQTFTYEDGLLVKSEFSSDNAKIYTYSNENNTISVFRTISPGTVEDATYFMNYDAPNNTSNVTDYYGNIIDTYNYDGMNSPNSLLFPSAYLRINNEGEGNLSAKLDENGVVRRYYEYEYNSEGYPTKSTLIIPDLGWYTQINEYVYN